MKFQIQNKKNCKIVELLITLNKIIKNQGTYFVVIMNNRLNLIMVLLSKVWENFFPKKSFSWEDRKLFWAKKLGEVIVLNRRTNDQIMPRFEKSFINNKCIFQ